MKRILKFLLYFFIISAVLRGVIEAFKDEPNEKETDKEEVVETQKEEPKKTNTKQEYKAIQTITDINGKWSYGDDVILFDSFRRVIQFNSGAEMKMDFLDATNKPDYPNEEFYVYGTIGNTKIFRSRVLINQSKDAIYLDRVDGDTSHYYKRISNLTEDEPKEVVAKKLSRNEQLDIIADSIFKKIPSTTWQLRFNEIVTNEDRALAIAQKMHPDPNDFLAQREAQIALEEQYFKRWAQAKFDWYNNLDLSEDEKYSVLYNIKAKISGIGIRNGWLDEYDKTNK